MTSESRMEQTARHCQAGAHTRRILAIIQAKLFERDEPVNGWVVNS